MGKGVVRDKVVSSDEGVKGRHGSRGRVPVRIVKPSLWIVKKVRSSASTDSPKIRETKNGNRRVAQAVVDPVRKVAQEGTSPSWQAYNASDGDCKQKHKVSDTSTSA